MNTTVGRPRRLGKPRVEPGEPLGAEPAAALPGDQRVEGHQPHRPVLDGVLDEPAVARQVSMAIEHARKHHPVVMVARHEIDGHAKRLELLAQPLVLSGLAALDQVARREHHVRPRLERIQMRDRAREVLRRAVDLLVSGSPACSDACR